MQHIEMLALFVVESLESLFRRSAVPAPFRFMLGDHGLVKSRPGALGGQPFTEFVEEFVSSGDWSGGSSQLTIVYWCCSVRRILARARRMFLSMREKA